MSIEGVPNGLMSVDVQTLNLLWDKDYVSNSLMQRVFRLAGAAYRVR